MDRWLFTTVAIPDEGGITTQLLQDELSVDADQAVFQVELESSYLKFRVCQVMGTPDGLGPLVRGPTVDDMSVPCQQLSPVPPSLPTPASSSEWKWSRVFMVGYSAEAAQ